MFLLLLAVPASACVQPWNVGAWIEIHSIHPTFSAWITFHGYHTFSIPFPVGEQFCACGLGFPGPPADRARSKAGGPLFGSIESVNGAAVIGVEGFSFLPNAATSASFEDQQPGTVYQGFLSGVSAAIPEDQEVELRFDMTVTPGTDPAILLKDVMAGTAGTAEGNADGTVNVDEHLSLLEIEDIEVQIAGDEPIVDIPTLSSFGLLLLASLFSGAAIYILRLRHGVIP